MTIERSTNDTQPYHAPAIASREHIEGLAIIGGQSDAKPPLCAA
jgi:hypothetical protein